MKKNERKPLSIQKKLVMLFMMTSLIVIVVNIIMFISINNIIREINRVYTTNVLINELSASIDSIQGSMTEYLNTKSTDSMKEYFDAEQKYKDDLLALENEKVGGDTDIMMENVVNLSDTYLTLTEETIQSKRGRIIEKYKVYYEDSTDVYSYINSYIYSMNNEQFKYNSANYSTLTKSFGSLETATVLILLAVSLVDIIFASVITKNLMDPVQEREIIMESHLKEAQLRYLQAQINPHFLFNTLNAGAQLAMMEGADRTYDYIQNMAAFFRYKIKRDGNDTTLADEIGLVDNYIYILNVRFSGEIHFTKSVNDSLTSVPVPGMILQPIVENSVNYGIRNIEREKKILLEVFGDGDNVCVRVTDNGEGMSQERITEVMNGSAGVNPVMKDSNGVGLKNVMSRLELYYGKKDILRISSEGKDRGTVVDIVIPRSGVHSIEDKQESENV
jgi:two-component system sensor histidine kinase YesM